MSTKINHGYLYKGDLNSLLLSPEFFNLRFDVVSRVVDLQAMAVAEFCAETLVDSHFTADPKTVGREVSDLLDAQAKECFFKSVGLGQKTRFDFENSLVAKPHPSRHGYLLVCLFFDNPELQELVVDALGLQKYWYNNAGDKPDSITEAEWTERQTAWMSALSRGNFIDSGFVVSEFRTSHRVLSMTDLVLHTNAQDIWQTACEKALSQQARELAFSDFLKAQPEGEDSRPLPSTCIRFLESERDSGFPNVSKKRDEIASLIKFPQVRDLFGFKLGTKADQAPVNVPGF
ncbi:hypothetical protein CL689_02430 [Candidatus Saccharibacteria bacterium]|nr:hypothetical protein [Candidatus Saccharibacteria bacterium]